MSLHPRSLLSSVVPQTWRSWWGRAAPDEIPATTVIGVLGADDMPAFRSLIADIGEEFGVDASIRLHVRSFSVRFAHHPDSATETHSHARPNWVLAWIAQL